MRFVPPKILFFCLLTFVFGGGLIGCQNEGDGFDLLLSGNNTSVEQLEITSFLPNLGDLTLEVDETADFAVNAVAPFPRTVSYSWSYDGVPVGGGGSFQVSAAAEDIGNHILIASVTDGVDTKTQIWNIKINGAPLVSPITEGIPKVSVDSSTVLAGTATDPNADSLTYSWLLNGVTSEFLISNGESGVLTGDASIVGANTVTLEVSDGTQVARLDWPVEVNYFPEACNKLSQGQICTYGGGPHKGNGLSVDNIQYPLRFRPIAHAQDSAGNVFFADYPNGLVWFWNRSTAPVTRVGQTIGPNIIQVIAGTGDLSSGGAGIPALQSPLNGPRGLAYDDINDVLYIAEYSGSLVKYIDTTGTLFVGMGSGTSHVDGASAFTHDCNNPSQVQLFNGDLYVTCYNHHRVKRWDLATGLAYVVAGDGGNNTDGENIAATTAGVGNPMGMFVDTSGLYIGSWRGDRVRYVNTTGVSVTFWSGHPSQVTIAPGNMATIMGDGGTGQTPVLGDPLASDISNPSGIVVRNGNEIYVSSQGRDNITLGNNSGADIVIDGLTIGDGKLGRINFNGGGYNGNGGINSVRVNDVYSMRLDVLDSSKILFGDYSNNRFRGLDLVTDATYHIAGSGRDSNGFNGDNPLPTTEHLLNFPGGLVFENSTQNLFFVDMNNHTTRKIDRYGLLNTVIGRGGLAGDPVIDNDIPSRAQMRTNINTTNNLHSGIDLWSDGTLAQLNPYGHNVRLWNRSGADRNYVNIFVQDDRVNTVAGDYISGPGTGGDGPALTSQMQFPNGVRFYDQDGNMEIWLADTMNHCIRRVDNDGDTTAMLGLCGTSGNPGASSTAANARFNRPRDIVFDERGNLFISDFINNTIWYWNRSLATVSIGTITVSPNQVSRIACLGGSAGDSAENIFASISRCRQPAGLAYKTGELCFAQRNRHNVRCIDTVSGRIRTVAGSFESSPRAGSVFDFSQEGIAATSARLYNPVAIAFDEQGDLYISDSQNHLIRKVKLSP